jgi:NitT/TauT family transport system permease protein
MKISGGLALIGAVVAEFAAGSGTSTGLAWVILQSGFNLKVAKAFAALALLSAIGIAIYALLSFVERQALKHWHESAQTGD